MPASRHVMWKSFLKLIHLPPKLLALISWIFDYFRIFILKNCEVCASKPWSFSSACENLSGQRKSWFRWVQIHIPNFVVSGPKFTGLSSPNTGGIAVDTLYSFPILDISICVGYTCICDRRLKLTEIAPNFATFLAPRFFLWEGPQILRHSLWNWTYFRSHGKVSERSAEKRNVSSKT